MFRGKSVCLSNIVFGKCLTSSFCPGKQLYFFVIWLTAHQTNIRLSRPFSVFLSAVQAPFPTIPVGCISGCPLFFSLSFHIDSKSIFRSPPFPLFWNRLGEDQRPIELHDDPEGVGLRAPIQARRAFFFRYFLVWFLRSSSSSKSAAFFILQGCPLPLPPDSFENRLCFCRFEPFRQVILNQRSQ